MHNDAPQSAGLLWTSDQLVAETSTWQHTTLTTDKYPCPRWNSNPRSQQVSGRRPLTCWDRGFESHRGHGYLSVVSVVCCQVEVSATSWSLVQRLSYDCIPCYMWSAPWGRRRSCASNMVAMLTGCDFLRIKTKRAIGWHEASVRICTHTNMHKPVVIYGTHTVCSSEATTAQNRPTSTVVSY